MSYFFERNGRTPRICKTHRDPSITASSCAVSQGLFHHHPIKLPFTASANLVTEQTKNLVVHGFLACRGKMDVDFVSDLADSLHKSGLFGFGGRAVGILIAHIFLSFPR
jgi:hypothetical protein